MKKMSEKSFKILKVTVLLAMVIACGFYYVLFVDGEIPKTMETTSLMVRKSITETTTKTIMIEENDIGEDFIIEIEPVDDCVATESMASILYQDDDIKESESHIDADGKININVASSIELQTLKNIGPVVASNIISYREEYGDFSCIDDIKNVKGIGDAKYNAIKDFIYAK